MNTGRSPTTVSPEAPEDAREAGAEAHDERVSVLERVMAREGRAPGSLHEAVVLSWSETAGTLAGGHAARLGASCLLRPAADDRVLVWTGGDGRCWILAVLERSDTAAACTIATSGPLALEAPRIGITGRAVHVCAEDLLTSTRNHHSVDGTRTVTARVRVAQVGTDIRRVTTSADTVEGTFMQRTGTWISHTIRDARLRARTFLFD